MPKPESFAAFKYCGEKEEKKEEEEEEEEEREKDGMSGREIKRRDK